jgi:hypothetical protein
VLHLVEQILIEISDARNHKHRVSDFILITRTTIQYYICTIRELLDSQPLFNPLNAELNPICHLLALLGAHHILHVSRVRVNRSLHEMDRTIVSLVRISNQQFFLEGVKD